MSEQQEQSTINQPKSIDHSMGFLTWQIAMCWQRQVNQALAKHGLTYTQFIVLAVTSWLWQKNEAVFQHQIALAARIDRMMTSRVLTSLEKKGFVKRDKETDDARTNTVRLTSKGDQILTDALKLVNEKEAEFFQREGFSEEEIIGYLQILLPEC
jgi:DNA-binding MarR family transcriptional regulator